MILVSAKVLKKLGNFSEKNGNTFNEVSENVTISTSSYFLASYPFQQSFICNFVLYLVICKAPIKENAMFEPYYYQKSGKRAILAASSRDIEKI